jgi:hypothetical protein
MKMSEQGLIVGNAKQISVRIKFPDQKTGGMWPPFLSDSMKSALTGDGDPLSCNQTIGPDNIQ